MTNDKFAFFVHWAAQNERVSVASTTLQSNAQLSSGLFFHFGATRKFIKACGKNKLKKQTPENSDLNSRPSFLPYWEVHKWIFNSIINFHLLYLPILSLPSSWKKLQSNSKRRATFCFFLLMTFLQTLCKMEKVGR